MAIKVNLYVVTLLIFVLFNLVIISDAAKSSPKVLEGKSGDKTNKTEQNTTDDSIALLTKVMTTIKPTVEEIKETVKAMVPEEDKETTEKPELHDGKPPEKQNNEKNENSKEENDRKSGKPPNKNENKKEKEPNKVAPTPKPKPVEPPKQNSESVTEKPKVVQTSKNEDKPDSDEFNNTGTKSSHTFRTFFIFFIFVIGCYLCLHNRNKILGMIVEGRSSRRGRRSLSGVRYRPLTTDEAAMESGIY